MNPQAVASAEHDGTAVAAGNGIYLVVWMEASYTTNSPDILGVRVRASDGARLDATPIFIGSGSSTQYRPSVAFDGNNFLVVWEQINSAPLVYGARVRASDGAVLDSSPLFISRTPMGPAQLPQSAPSVAFDGTNYLVAWSGYIWETNNTVSSAVLGMRVRASDGTCIESSSFVISRGEAYSVRVAYQDGAYLVAWNSSQGLRAARVHALAGQVMDPVSISLTSSAVGSPSVAAGDGSFLVSWRESDNTLAAQELLASSGAKTRAWSSLRQLSAVNSPEATYDGGNFWIGWQGMRDGVRQAMARRLSRGAEVPDDAEVVLGPVTNSASTQQLRGGIASAGTGRILMTYTAYDTTASKPRAQMRLVTGDGPHVSQELAVEPTLTTGTADHYSSAAAAGPDISLVVWSEVTPDRPIILGVRVRTSDGARLDATPLRIGTAPFSVSLEPAVAFDGTNFLVVWEQIGGYPLIRGARVRASDGAVLDSTPFLISATLTNGYPLPQFTPAVAFDGTNYLVTWEGYYYENGPVYSGIQAIRVRPDGTLMDPHSIIIARDGVHSRVAASSGSFLVTWQRNQNVEAARLSGSSGQVLDATPLSLTSASITGQGPAVAARPGEFLVTWVGSDSTLWARRISASDGVKLGAADLAVGPSALSSPEATFDGQDYRLAWVATRLGGHVVLGTRVSKLGVVEADAELLISALQPAPGYRPGLAAWERGLFLTSYTQADTATSRIRTKFRLVSDVRPPEVCEDAGEPTLVLNGSAETLLECGSGPYRDPGAQAFDACGNPLEVHAYNTGSDSSGPGPNTSFEGSYMVSYAAWDARGHTVSALRTVTVDDRMAPVLRLIGPAFMTHTCGSQWVDPGVQATDACYGNLSPQVRHTGEVNGWVPGTYTVAYSLTDSGGNSATPVTRTVEVANCPW